MHKCPKIWKVDVLPYWESHWDYENRKPKNMGLVLAQQKKNHRDSQPRKNSGKPSSSFWNVFKRKKKAAKKYEKRSLRKNSENENDDIKIEENLEEDDGELEIGLESKDKSLLLVTLWRRGIPDWLRSILWPITISNQLEV